MSLLTRRDPNRYPTLSSWFENAFNEPFFTRSFPIAAIEEGTLALDLSEDDKAVIVRASLPGFKKEDLDIEVHDGVLSINAKHNEEKEEKTERFYRKERTMNSMSRRVALPAAVLDKEAVADLKDGVLTLRLPKTIKSQPQRIPIRQG